MWISGSRYEYWLKHYSDMLVTLISNPMRITSIGTPTETPIVKLYCVRPFSFF